MDTNKLRVGDIVFISGRIFRIYLITNIKRVEIEMNGCRSYEYELFRSDDNKTVYWDQISYRFESLVKISEEESYF